MKKVELNIIALSNSESSKGNYALILEEIQGHRRLPIIIGAFEAQAIAMYLEKMQPKRPLTHDLFKNTLDLSGVSISEIFISELIEGVFYAQLIGKKADGSDLNIDARTSDAIALAVRYDCPIYTTEQIMGSEGITVESTSSSVSKKRGNLSDYTLSELEEMLTNVLAKEDYESASRIRDAIEKKK